MWKKHLSFHRDVSKALKVKYDTLRKAINAGRLSESKNQETAISKSSRTVVDKGGCHSFQVH
jgi:hypothetical protein